MSIIKRVGNFFRNIIPPEEILPPARTKPKVPIKGKLTYRGASPEKVKNIIEQQKLMNTKTFINNVDKSIKWPNSLYICHPALEVFNDVEIVTVISKLNKDELLALKVALSKATLYYPDYYLVSRKLSKALKERGYKYNKAKR